jgi:hypothetical protein
MRHAQQTLAAEPVLQRSPPPSPVGPPDSQAATDDIDGEIAERLKQLDSDQLAHVAEALGRHVDGGADDDALRQSIAAWVDEWASDTAEDWSDEDPEAARAAGREEAISKLWIVGTTWRLWL